MGTTLVIAAGLADGGLGLALAAHTWRGMQVKHTLVTAVPAEAPRCSEASAVVLFGMELSDASLPAWLPAFAGPVYGVSVGIGTRLVPGALDVFDHLFVRSPSDLSAALEAGADEANVTLSTDLGFTFLAKEGPGRPQPLARAMQSRRPLLGVCLSAASEPCCSLESVAALLAELAEHFAVCLLAFEPEDARWNRELGALDRRLHVVDAPQLWDPLAMCRLFSHLDGVVTMHYTGTMFARKVGVPCTIYRPSHAMSKVPGVVSLGDAAGIVTYMARVRVGSLPRPAPVPQPRDALVQVKAVLGQCPRRAVRVPRAKVRSVGEATAVLEQLLENYSGLPAADVQEWLQGPGGGLEELDPAEVARMFNFAVCGQVGARFLRELERRIFAGESPASALAWLVERHQAEHHDDAYCPRVYEPPAPAAPTIVDLSYFDQNDCDGVHRHGWAWVLRGLHNYDGKAIGRTPTLKLDAYLDRTMLWGYETLKAAGVLPYKTPWAGFVHHTFSGGAERMFERPLFLESLPHCKGLFVLSEYLGTQVRAALEARGFAGRIKVHVVRHPMERVPQSKAFGMDHFLRNQERKVVQVGAWLRNTWSIFNLGISKRRGDFGLGKAALIGPSMAEYYKPTGIMERLEEAVLAAHAPPMGDNMCRLGTAPLAYGKGIVDMVKAMDASVVLVPRLDDEAYDELLKANIVFLHLTDASAVNTVLECIVRGTPLIVNRHPALEEVLLPSYPGFYEDLVEAASMATDLRVLGRAREHMLALPKDGLRLSVFLEGVQRGLAAP
ncbi:hypothetical protein COO60DRAFT_1643799 [Scenedesmus sp. NREL 46B-D3]|nr:hypothetical protein COO60DRAFT_1643799 [Scenedesmus sp. NREL 46B-D3]